MKFKRLRFVIILFILIFNLFGCNLNDEFTNYVNNNNFVVHYIAVGQGDSVLIQVNNKNLLIDSGSRSNKNDLFNYLSSLKIIRLDYIIATHPHEDHIGNMSDLIKKYDIGSFYSPKIETTSKTFEKMVDALIDKNLKINVITPSTDSIDLGPDTKVTFYSPNKNTYDNLNNYSPILKIQYGSNKFLFNGDAEKEVENEILDNNADIKADVIKLGHHGSSSSSSEDFISKVSPKIGIISCGKDNEYGHPHKETLNRLSTHNIKTYRTDEDGTIVLSSDGTTITKVS